VPITFTETVQDAPEARLAPDKVDDDEPLTAVAVPPQVLDNPFGVATIKPEGRLSVKATPVSVRFALVLVIVKVRLVLPFSGMVLAPKALLIVGGLMTVRLAEDVLPVPAAVESIVTLLFMTPSGEPVTFTAMVQLPTLNVAFVKLTELDPATAVAVPPQVFVRPFGVATTSPLGSESVKLASMATTFPLVTLKVRLVVPFTAMFAAPKLLVMEGGCNTAIFAVTVALSTVASARPCPPVPPALKVAVAVPLA